VFVIAFSILLLALSASVGYEFATRSSGVETHEMRGETVNSVAARLAVWSFAAETARAAPITGYGPALGQAAINTTYAESGFFWGVRESLNPHNQFLSTYLDLGIAGLCILVALLIHCLVIGFRSDDLLLLGFTMLIVVFFCFESVLVRQK